MRTKFKVVIGIFMVLLVTMVAGYYFLRYEIRKSFPATAGTLEVNGLQQQVRVTRDEYGVPRIAAKNEHDLMLAFGYVHAQDRLWQMDMARRIGQGRLSELFGAVTIPFDKMFRIVGIKRISEEVEKSITPASRARLVAYAAGVNAFIQSHKGKYPVEFDLLRYEPEEWRPLHSIMVARLMAWELNLSWWTDLTYGAIFARVGEAKGKEILPSFPATVAPIVASSGWSATATAAMDFLSTAHEYCAFRGIGGTLGGSNAWVVGRKKSESNSIILANDTHLQLTNPSKWYEVHLVAPGYNVSGFSVAGIPGVVAGNNASIAWGLTNVMADDADFYIEKIDSANSGNYIYDGQSLPIRSHEEEIQVRNDTSVFVTVRATHHGPIVTDIKTRLKKADYPFVASMRWTGSEVSDQIEAFNRIDKANTWDEFLDGVKQFSGPGQNFVYGDTSGNIGYWCGVKLPIRSASVSSILPLNGWEKETEWKGYVPFEKLPHLFNPREGYIATANNKITDDSYPYFISALWEPPSRIQRLREVLGKDGNFSVGDFEVLQNDKYSYFAKELTPYIIAACKSSSLEDKEKVLEYLSTWNFVFSKEDVATSIFQEFLTHFVKNIYEDEMGPDLLHDFLVLVNVPLRVTTRLVEEGTSTWFDNVRTPATETRDDIIRQSMKEAVAALREQFGTETKNWQWGNLHTVTLQHPFGLQKPLDKVFNIGPYPYGGGSTTMMSGEYSFNDVLQPNELNRPFGVSVGASFRRIVNMARPFEARTILPTGQSGQAFSKHYDDQTMLWLNGAYKTSRWDEASAANAPEQLILKPSSRGEEK